MYIFYKDGTHKKVTDRIRKGEILNDENVIAVGKYTQFNNRHLTAVWVLTRQDNGVNYRVKFCDICDKLREFGKNAGITHYHCPGNGRELNEYWLREWFGLMVTH